jgi:hypothetical protein
MSLWSKIFLGTDLDEEQAKQNELDSQLAALNQDALNRGVWDQKTYDQAQANLEAGRVDVSQQVGEAAMEGAREGMNAEIALVTQGIPNAVNSTLSAGVGVIFKSIPISLWLLAGVGLFIWMGGLLWLQGRLAR